MVAISPTCGIVEASTGIVGLDFVSPNNTCLGFNNSTCWAQGNHQLYNTVIRHYIITMSLEKNQKYHY